VTARTLNIRLKLYDLIRTYQDAGHQPNAATLCRDALDTIRPAPGVVEVTEALQQMELAGHVSARGENKRYGTMPAGDAWVDRERA
jgi:hypothetical protein